MNPSSDSLFSTYIGTLEEVIYQYASDRKKETLELSKLKQKILKIESFTPLTDKLKPLAKMMGEQKHQIFHKMLKQYAKGSEIDSIDIKLLAFLPDYLAAYYHFNPELMSYIPGCSSLLYQDTEGNNQHLRILDYSLTNFFTENEEIVNFKINDCYSFTSIGVKGFPLPFYTLINEKGLTLALHQRISSKFFSSGENIFSIMFELASKASNVKEVKEILKQKQSLTSWGIVAMETSGGILHTELGGDDHQFESYQVSKNQFYYFNREPIKKDTCPLASLEELSKKQALFIKNQFKSLQKKKLSHIDTFIELTNHFNELPLENNLLTISSVQAVQLSAKNEELLFKTGSAPKVHGTYHHYQDIYQEPKLEIIDFNENDPSLKLFHQGLKRISSAQFFYDTGEKEKAFHELQMAMTLIEEGPLYIVAKFNFLIWQYIAFNTKKDLQALYREMKDIYPKLPLALADHAKLFLMRLEKICGLEVSIRKDDITSVTLQKLFEKEIKLKPAVLRVLKFLIFPRLELFDIIYLY